MVTYSNNFDGLWSLARHKIRDFSLENQRFAVGVSGGADSIGLFYVFSDFLKKNIISDLVVFHINFGLRGSESDGDEGFVRDLCKTHAVPFHGEKPKKPITSAIQETARQIRLEIQENYVKQGFLIALAHNADDVAETAIMRLCRGTSLQQAAGMTYFNGEIFRPWLDLPRQTIRAALVQSQRTWREDSSNLTSSYDRNRIRNEIIPILNSMFPGASARISNVFLSEFSDPSGGLKMAEPRVPLAYFQNKAQKVLDVLVHDWLSNHFQGRCPVSRQVIHKVSQAILSHGAGSRESKEFHLPEGKTLKISGNELILCLRN